MGFGAFAQWLLGFSKSVLIWLYNYGIDFLQTLFDSGIDFLVSCIDLLPTGPSLPTMLATPTGDLFTKIISCLNWIFPVGYSIDLFTFLVAAILVYAAAMWLMRWLKVYT